MSDQKKPREYYPDQPQMSDHEQAVDAVASSIGVYDEQLCQEMLDLGYDSDTAPFIGFIPMIHVAWADGVVDEKERKMLNKMATARGVEEGTKVYTFFQRLINEQPSADFFQRSMSVVGRIIRRFPEDVQTDSLKDLSDFCVAVAEASGGVMGFGNKVSDEERTLLREIAGELQSDDSVAGRDLLKKMLG